MKEILVISGKGGTGKTTVTACLADLAAKELSLVLADADVDAANLELLLEPRREETFSFNAGRVAVIDTNVCIQCGECAEVCRFDAVRQDELGAYVIDAAFCEGCLACLHECTVNAITSSIHQSGEWYRSTSAYGPLFHANLYPGEENSGKLVTQIKTDAKAFGRQNDADLFLIDGPPGIGCPVTAACSDADAAVIVSEPTLTGFHDMQRVNDVAKHFGIPTMLIINKCDLNREIQQEMQLFAQQNQIPVAGLIPYDEEILHAQQMGKPITQSLEKDFGQLFTDIWEFIHNLVFE